MTKSRYITETPSKSLEIITYPVAGWDLDGKPVTRWNAREVNRDITAAGENEKDAYQKLIAYIERKDKGLTPKPKPKL